MSIRIKPDYLAFSELARRWKLEPGSFDIHRAILNGSLRPSLYVNAPLFRIKLVDGAPLPLTGEREALSGWFYPVYLQQIAELDCAFQLVAEVAEPTEETPLWALDTPMQLGELLQRGVVMMPDLQQTEHALGGSGDELSAKDERTRDKMIVSMAFQLYGWDPAGDKSKGVTEMMRDAQANGIPVSYNTLKKHLRRAWERCPPLLEPAETVN